MISRAETNDLVFDAVFQAVPQANNEQLHQFCLKKFHSSGSKGCIYLSYENMNQMLHTDQHRMSWKPLSAVEELEGLQSTPTYATQLMSDLRSYEPEDCYILLVSCPMPTTSAAANHSNATPANNNNNTDKDQEASSEAEQTTLVFKHKIIDGKSAMQVPPPVIREQILQIPICYNCRQPKDKLYRCGACAGVLYCSKECSKAHWAEHKPTCLELRKQKAPQNQAQK